MRTAVLKAQVKECYDLLNIKSEKIISNGNTYQKINNWKKISWALYKLNEFKFMGNSVKNIFNMGANFMASTDSTSIVTSDYQKFLNYFDIVKAKCEAIINMENGEIDDSNDENYLYVKLPNNLKELDDLNTIVKGLNLVFNQCPILRDTYKEIDFVGVDVGSSWLILSVILASAPVAAKTLDWIADFIKKCNDIRIQNRTIKQMDLEYLIKKMKFNKDQEEEKLQELKNEIEKDNKEQYIKEFESMEISNQSKISEEDKTKIAHCMSTMVKLLDMGVELYPSLNASEELKSAFPKKEEWEKISGETKLLNEKNDKQ